MINKYASNIDNLKEVSATDELLTSINIKPSYIKSGGGKIRLFYAPATKAAEGNGGDVKIGNRLLFAFVTNTKMKASHFPLGDPGRYTGAIVTTPMNMRVYNLDKLNPNIKAPAATEVDKVQLGVFASGDRAVEENLPYTNKVIEQTFKK